MTHPDLPEADSWSAARDGFAWALPERYNIGELINRRWARRDPGRVALLALGEDGAVRCWRHGELARRAAQFANLLRARGVGRGDRVALLLPQTAEALLTHLACSILGAVSVPLFTLFGEEGLAYRLEDSGAAALVTDAANLPKIAAIRDRTPALATVLCVDGPGDGAEDFHALLDRAADRAEAVATGPDDPALISYTSGTTGPPKGALHGHRVLAAHAVGARLVYDFLPREGDVMWTPADWAWMGGSMNAMAPALHFGLPLIAHRMARFDPERAFDLIARHGVTVSFLPPTALKLMRRVPRPERFGARLRAVGSAGEPMGAGVLDWGRGALGLSINEFFGQTESNMLIGNNARLMTPRPGSMGLAMPGHEAAILGPEGAPLPHGETGELAFRAAGDAGMFLGYWNKPEKTAEKFLNGWMLTGDEARRDEDGYFYFTSRTDDVITSSGYRVGPAEIEECLAGRPEVAVAAVVGAPDPIRTERIVAYVKPSPGTEISDELAAALTAHVRSRLSPHMAPSEVRFIDEIPMTASGKILRRELRGRLTG